MSGEPINVLYIAGYGRSGSTLLERLLATHNQILGAGELYYLPQQMQHSASRCGCGNPLSSCELWPSVFTDLREAYGDPGEIRSIFRRNEAFPTILRTMFCTGTLFNKVYRQLNTQLFQSIWNRSDQPKYVIDSSKTARLTALRPFGLQSCHRISVRVLHLTRDPRGCLCSNLKGSNREQEPDRVIRNDIWRDIVSHPLPRTGLHWPLANLSGLGGQMMPAGKRYIRVKYEELCSRPLEVLNRIETFLDLSLQSVRDVVKQDIPLSGTHQVSGNRMRYVPDMTVRSDREVWKDRLSWKQLALFDLLGGVSRHLFGY